ncbi:uncharacterized protein N7483_006449 [Penicillium malachiteum]|uniref:uncharacterized protein n=1 Tax=Penicillium malachiteum TaxID=1324776 RepID=UPI00254720E0|nr:uncharacterized protein N7483_006449 [Penicillium malachiteum]KAJ5725092.1 hypothetical protein N7483_006449 [Penicillium malachiteum]
MVSPEEKMELMTGEQIPHSERIREQPGCIFDAAEGSALMHACSASGAWGKGIALDFRKNFPKQYREYRAHCMNLEKSRQMHDIPNLNPKGPRKISVPLPIGTALIIAPQYSSTVRSRRKKDYWLICLFTSTDYGLRVDSPDTIINNTAAALNDLKSQLWRLAGGTAPHQIYSCRMNSGLFNVPWERTRALLEEIPVPLKITVAYKPPIGGQQNNSAEASNSKQKSKISFGIMA